MIVISVWLSFKQQSNYAAKISNLTSTEKNMTVGAKINYARAIKLDLTLFSFGFYIFEVFSRLLNSRRRLQDVQTETIRSEQLDNHLCLRVLRHAQQQDKLNAKRIIHGICSIFRLFLYQINTKFVLTVSRRIHFLSSIHQHLNHAIYTAEKKKTNKCEETWRHQARTQSLFNCFLDERRLGNILSSQKTIKQRLGTSLWRHRDATTATLQQTRFIAIHRNPKK